MRNRASRVITILLLLTLLGMSIFAALNRDTIFPSTETMPENYAYLELPRLNGVARAPWVPGSTLKVYPRAGGLEVPIGEFTGFIVELSGEIITYHDLTYEIVSGRDCAAVYYDGSLRGLGLGEVVVKAWLDNDSSVYGYGAVRVVPAVSETAYIAALPEAAAAQLGDAAFEASIEGFPESYRVHLRALHAKYPAWIFEPFYTGLDFFEAVYAESLYGRNVTLMWNMANIVKSNTVASYNPGTGEYTGTGWVDVNDMAVSHYMDPRNFLDEKSIFQFEALDYNPAIHNVEGIDGLLAGSFMYQADTGYLNTQGNYIESDMTFAEVILEAGRLADINPYFLAAKIRQEIGSFPSGSVTGDLAGHEGYYNFFNIGATDGKGEVERGLTYAAGSGSYGRPWTSPYRSILGGAEFLREAYLGAGQTTGYLQKFNVNPNGLYEIYTNQYMTNVSGAVAQALGAYEGYASGGLLDDAIVFSIPVFENMPGRTQVADSVSLGGNSWGIVIRDAALREGPAAYRDPVAGGELKRGDIVTIARALGSEADYFQSRLFYPVWYEIMIERGGETLTGYVSEEYILRGSSRVLGVGEGFQLNPVVTPVGSDDVVRFISENPGVAQVSSAGVVTALSPGVVNIIGYTASGAADCYRITVR